MRNDAALGYDIRHLDANGRGITFAYLADCSEVRGTYHGTIELR
jgi:hypothetical protein